LSADDEALLTPWLDRSAHQVYACFWKWPTLSRARLRAHLNAGDVYGLRDGAHLRAWAIGKLEPSWDVLGLLYLDAVDHASMVEMAQALRRVALDAQAQAVEGAALAPSPMLTGLSEAGYDVDEYDFWIMELPLS
jgi:hypothetical protein